MKPLLDERTRGLIKAGLIRPVDLVFSLGVLAMFFVSLMWVIFAHPPLLHVMVAAVGLMGWMQLWMVMLMFRVGLLVLEMQAQIGMLPEDAARLVHRFALGIGKHPVPAGQ